MEPRSRERHLFLRSEAFEVTAASMGGSPPRSTLHLEPEKELRNMLRKNQLRRQRGAALVEYALLVAGVALVTAAAVSVFGHKTNDMISAVATVLPGAHPDDNGPILSGHMIETAPTAVPGAPIGIDTAAIVTNSNTTRLSGNLGVTLDSLILESN
jgi:Flp pilus assembly pilin Flp